MYVLHVLPIAVALTSVALPLSAAPSQKDAPERLREYKTVSSFLRAVDEYVVVHRVDGPLEEKLCLPDEAYASIRSLAAVPLDARPLPQEGDIFLPDVADLFRDEIARMLHHSEYHPPDFAAQMNVEELTTPPIVVNTPLPWGVGRWTFTWLLATLPALPEDLEYRLVGRNLVLVDVRANIVVDVLRGAVPVH